MADIVLRRMEANEVAICESVWHGTGKSRGYQRVNEVQKNGGGCRSEQEDAGQKM